MKATKQHGLVQVGHLDGYYCLYANGDLVFKHALDSGQVTDFEGSNFVKAYWLLDKTERGCAWVIAVEAGAMGARPERIRELARKWELTDADAQRFVEAVGATVRLIRDGDQWMAAFADFVNAQESQCGFGPTCLDALIELARQGLA